MDKRVDDLEIRYAFLEDRVEALDGVVRDLADLVDGLRGELRELREQMARQEGPGGTLEDEVPPHY